MKTGEEAIHKIKTSYVREVDMTPISDYCKGAFGSPTSYAISFREAGEDTLKRLNDGAAAKGHNILEKSIKDKSMGGNLSKIPDNIKGLIGHWEKKAPRVDALDGKDLCLTGVYITNCYLESTSLGSKSIGTVKYITFNDTAREGEITVTQFRDSLGLTTSCKQTYDSSKLTNLNFLSQIIQENKTKSFSCGIQNIYHCFYTGDYDLHDIIFFNNVEAATTTAGKVYPKADFSVINGLSTKITSNTAYNRKSGKEFCVIRHGPQCSYLSHIQNHGDPIVLGLLRADLPIAMCHRGAWSILENETDLIKFYTDNIKIPIHSVWKLASDEEDKASVKTYINKLKSYIVFKNLKSKSIEQMAASVITEVEAEITRMEDINSRL